MRIRRYAEMVGEVCAGFLIIGMVVAALAEAVSPLAVLIAEVVAP